MADFTLRRSLEDLTVEDLWQLYLVANPPPADYPAEMLAQIRGHFMAALGSMLVVAERLHAEPAERREIILSMLKSQLTTADA